MQKITFHSVAQDGNYTVYDYQYQYHNAGNDVFTVTDANSISARFMIHSDVNLVDEIGNGATCQDGYCSINRKASSDMADVIAQLEPPALEPGDMGGVGGSPLMILNTVDADLAERFAQNGYATLADIAAIPDPAMATVQMQVNISLNRLSFIRRQAELILASSDVAREELGMGDRVAE